MTPYFETEDRCSALYAGDSCRLLYELPLEADMVFSDPPYFLSNGGFSVHAGKCVSVNKGEWDKSNGRAADIAFTHKWVKGCRERLKESGTIWVCGTFHNIFSVAEVLSDLDFRILNAITWQKTNPPPNLSCRFFTHSTEVIVWARKCKKVPHYYNYDLMHRLAGDRQMTDVWRMPAIATWEKTFGKHPAQKPIALMVRAILAATREGELILDPFAGSSSTGIAANITRRRFVGIEKHLPFLEISRNRLKSFDSMEAQWRAHIPDLKHLSLC